MGILYLRKGDLFEEEAEVVKVVTVNCVGAMGAGVALTCKQRYPEVYARYRAQCDKAQWKPGNVWYTEANDGTRLLLAATKDHWRYPSRYPWVEACLKRIAVFVEREQVNTLALTHLGCGNGKLDPVIVRKMTDDELGAALVDVHLYF